MVIAEILQFPFPLMTSSLLDFNLELFLRRSLWYDFVYLRFNCRRFCCRVDKEDEMECLIKGCNFLLRNIPDEAFRFQRHGNPEYVFRTTDADNTFPYLLVNIGSGVSILKVMTVTTDVPPLTSVTDAATG